MPDLRKLKDEAFGAAGGGNWKRAASLFASLEQHERDGLWPLKLGECLRKMGHNAEACKALARAVDLYAKADLLLKAIAVCKIILDIDPRHSKTQQMLAAFHASHARAQASPLAAPASPPPRSGASGNRHATSLAWAPVAHALGSSTTIRRPAGLVSAAGPASVRLAPLQAPSEAEPASALLQDFELAVLLPGARPSDQLPAQNEGNAFEIAIDLPAPGADDPKAGSGKRRGSRTLARMTLPKTPFFSAMTEEQLRTAIERVQLVQLETGEILFGMGDPGRVLYVVASGEIAVLVPQEVARLQEGDFFGEIALLANQPRSATTRATMPSQVLALDRALVRDLIAGSPELLKVMLRFVRDRLIATLAHTSPLFTPFSEMERVLLTSKFRFLEVDRNVRVLEQGQKVSGLFILLAGEAAAVTDGAPVAHLQAGDVFGEIALIQGSAAMATIVTLQKSFVLHLPRSDFNEMIMTHPQVLEYLSSLAHNRMKDIGRLSLV
jgi:CRP-like cAMP-binding protein